MSHPASHHRRETNGIQGPPPYPEHRDQQRGASESGHTTVEPEVIIILAAESKNKNRATRFAYIALADVVRSGLPIAGWGEHDYKYLAVLAHALENDSLPLEALTWNTGAGLSRERAVAARAMIAHIISERRKAVASNDEDILADVSNDTCYLAGLFQLHNADNPFVTAEDVEQMLKQDSD